MNKKWLILILGILLLLVVVWSLREADKNSQSEIQSVTPSFVEGATLSPTVLPEEEKNDAGEEVSYQKSSVYTLDEFKTKYGAHWKLMTNSKGKITNLTGDKISGIGRDERKVLEFAREIAPLLGTTAQTFGENSLSRTQESGLSKTFFVQQSVDGFDIYQGYMTLVTDKKNGDGFLIDNATKAPSSFDHTAKIGSDEAQTIVRQYFADKQIQIKLVSSQPSIFVATSGVTELAWVFSVTETNGTTKLIWEVVVGAESGQVLHRQSSFRVN